MGFEQELIGIKNYINDFDPLEFTTAIDQIERVDPESQMRSAERFKARIRRKQLLKKKFQTSDFLNQYDSSDVMITQEQIDALLNKF